MVFGAWRFLKVARSILRLEELGLALASPEFCAQQSSEPCDYAHGEHVGPLLVPKKPQETGKTLEEHCSGSFLQLHVIHNRRVALFQITH